MAFVVSFYIPLLSFFMKMEGYDPWLLFLCVGAFILSFFLLFVLISPSSDASERLCCVIVLLAFFLYLNISFLFEARICKILIGRNWKILLVNFTIRLCISHYTINWFCF